MNCFSCSFDLGISYHKRSLSYSLELQGKSVVGRGVGKWYSFFYFLGLMSIVISFWPLDYLSLVQVWLFYVLLKVCTFSKYSILTCRLRQFLKKYQNWLNYSGKVPSLSFYLFGCQENRHNLLQSTHSYSLVIYFRQSEVSLSNLGKSGLMVNGVSW